MKEKTTLIARDVALTGLMIALIEVSKSVLLFLPNIELTSFWLIIFTRYFGKKMIPVIPAFILIEGAMFGFGLWWIMYLYVWPLLAILAWHFRKQSSVWFWSTLSSVFGLCFGLLCSIPYIWVGSPGHGIQAGLYAAFTWWIAGIPWDIVHGVGNFVLMLALYLPITKCLEKLDMQVL